METKHTPGPWKVDSEYPERITDSNNDGIADCVDWFSYKTWEEKEENAKLISAAPELLEALIAALPYVKHSGLKVTVEKVEAAIEKATGQKL